MVRYQIQRGRKVSFIPGWDCHGLPIELKALQALRRTTAERDPAAVLANSSDMTPAQIRDLAKNLASETIESQKKTFKSWGIIGDWDNAWKTMGRYVPLLRLRVCEIYLTSILVDKDYEIRQLEVFKEMLKKGSIIMSAHVKLC